VLLNAGVLVEKLPGGDFEAIFQAQDIVRGKDNGGFAATLSKAGDSRMAAKPEAAL
jgi:hypothetical protein